MSADELGCGVQRDVRAVEEWLAQIRRCHGVVDHERDAVFVGDRRDGLEIENVPLRVADRLGVEGLRIGTDRVAPRFKVVRIVNEADFDAQLGERVMQQVVSAPVEGRRGDDVSPVLGQIEQRDRLCSLTARHCQCSDPAVEGGHTLFEDCLCRVHDACVDVAELGKPEQCRGVRGVPEDVACRLVDRHRSGARGRVGYSPGVYLAGLKTPVGHIRGPPLLAASSRVR